MKALAVVVVAGAMSLVPQIVEACSCGGGGAQSGFFAGDGPAPANIPGMFWYSEDQEPKPNLFVVDALEASGAKPIGFHIERLEVPGFPFAARIEPKAPWKPGSKFRFGYIRDGKEQSTVVTVSADKLDWSEHATLTLEKTATVRGEVALPAPISCRRSIDATGQMVSVNPGDWKQFATHLAYAVRPKEATDWEPTGSLCTIRVPGRTSQGLGRELLYRPCTDGKAGAPAAFEVVVSLPSDPTAKPIVVGEVEVDDKCGVGSRPTEPDFQNAHDLTVKLRAAQAQPASPKEPVEPQPNVDPQPAKPATGSGCATANERPSGGIGLFAFACVFGAVRRRQRVA